MSTFEKIQEALSPEAKKEKKLKKEARRRTRAKRVIVGAILVTMVMWVAIFCTGMFSPSENYRYYVRTQIRNGNWEFFDILHSLIIIMFSWTWTNLLLLSCIAAALGEIARPNQTRPVFTKAFARGIFIYFVILGGQMLFVGGFSIPQNKSVEEFSSSEILKTFMEYNDLKKELSLQSELSSKDSESLKKKRDRFKVVTEKFASLMGAKKEGKEQDSYFKLFIDTAIKAKTFHDEKGLTHFRYFKDNVIIVDKKNLSDVSLNQYFKLAGFCSLLCFLVGYNPAIFASIADKIGDAAKQNIQGPVKSSDSNIGKSG